jgi:sulfur carrier protein
MRINGLHHDIPSLSVSQLLHEVSLPTKGVAVAVNGEIVRRSEWETFVVQSEDTVEILTAAAGG